jgi:photosystem II stability/assembly factor-like uncharacterized protein
MTRSFLLTIVVLCALTSPVVSQPNYWAPVAFPSSGGIHALLFDSHGHLFAGTDLDGLLFRSTDKGGTWIPADNGLTLYTSVRALAEDHGGGILAGTSDGLFRSTDDGLTWHQVGFGSRSVNALTVNKNGDLYAGMDRGSVYKSTDNAANWVLSDTVNPALNFQAIGITKNGVILSGTTSAFFFSLGAIRRSANNGSTWTDANNGLVVDNICSFATSPSGAIYTGTDSGGVYRSTDDGVNWDGTSMMTHAVYALAVNDSGHVFAGTRDAGMWRSTDKGDSWDEINDGLTANTIQSLAFDGTQRLYAGSDGGGMFKSISATTPVEGGGQILPASYTVHQNYPNPFNPSTVIRYDLPGQHYVSLKVYNILGHEVASLAEGVQGPGQQSVRWDASGLPSGLYFYRLEFGGTVTTKKMVLMR